MNSSSVMSIVHTPSISANHRPAPADTVSDDELIQRAQAGDRAAFGQLVERYMKRAYYTALALTGSHEDACDLSQEAFVRAFRAIHRFQIGTSRFFTWYYRILMNLYLNTIRDRKRRLRLLDRYARYLQRRRSSESTTAEQVEREAIRQRVWAAMMQLKPNDRVLILLKDFRGMSYNEIAELMGIPPGTVMSRLYHARKRLKKILGEKP